MKKLLLTSTIDRYYLGDVDTYRNDAQQIINVYPTMSFNDDGSFQSLDVMVLEEPTQPQEAHSI